MLEGYGLRDLDTLFRMASREPLIITPEQVREEMAKVDEVLAEINGLYR